MPATRRHSRSARARDLRSEVRAVTCALEILVLSREPERRTPHTPHAADSAAPPSTDAPACGTATDPAEEAMRCSSRGVHASVSASHMHPIMARRVAGIHAPLPPTVRRSRMVGGGSERQVAARLGRAGQSMAFMVNDWRGRAQRGWYCQDMVVWCVERQCMSRASRFRSRSEATSPRTRRRGMAWLHLSSHDYARPG